MVNSLGRNQQEVTRTKPQIISQKREDELSKLELNQDSAQYLRVP